MSQHLLSCSRSGSFALWINKALFRVVKQSVGPSAARQKILFHTYSEQDHLGISYTICSVDSSQSSAVSTFRECANGIIHRINDNINAAETEFNAPVEITFIYSWKRIHWTTFSLSVKTILLNRVSTTLRRIYVRCANISICMSLKYSCNYR